MFLQEAAELRKELKPTGKLVGFMSQAIRFWRNNTSKKKCMHAVKILRCYYFN